VAFDVTIPRFVLAKTLGRVSDAALFGSLSGVRLRSLPDPTLPGEEWVKLEVLSCGICGSDLGNLTYSASPAMEPFGSFPAVLGHEVVGRVLEVGAGVRHVEPGQRVSVDPMISCATRGFAEPDWCRSCRDGYHSTCERAGEEGRVRVGGRPLRPGLTVGYHADLRGGWGDRMLAHASQVFPVADGIPDRRAVLMEPFAIAMHAVLQTPPRPGEPVLVIGSGTIAMGTIWALRATGFEGDIVAQAKRPHERTLARAMGASEVVAPGPEAREALVATGASAYMPVVGPEVYAGGGFPLIYDCVGNATSLSQALRFAAPRGRLVVIGCVAEIRKLDLTFLWARELRARGSVGYGRESWRGETRHTFEITHDLMLASDAPIEDLVTHVFPLAEYRDALRAARDHRRSGAVKVVLAPNA